MGFGLLIIASIGIENCYFNTNPSITYFKKIYKTDTNISNENLPQYFRSSPNFGRRLSTRIAKNSDMIKDITIYFELPDIQPSNHTTLPDGIKQFSWANKIGFAMIRYIDLEIGGVLISRHYGDWLNIQYETKWNDDEGWKKNIGNNVTLLTDYSNGKSSYKLYIPLSFFFNEIGFPLISISKQDIEIHVELNDFSQCYKQTPTHYFEIDSYVCLYKKDEVITQNVDGSKSGGTFVYFDINYKRVYYNKLYNDFLIPSSTNSNSTKYNITGQTSGFYSQPKVGSIIVKDEDYFPSVYPALKDAYILVNYIYLDSDERWYFLNKEIQYIVPLVSNVLEKDITGINSNYNLKLVNPHKVIYWRAQFNSNLNINDVFNYSSLPLTNNEEPLIQSSKILINSIARNEIYNNEYYERVQPYINKTFSNRNISMFSFGFDPLNYNPKGTMNFSMVDDAIIQFSLNKLVNYTNSINVRAYGLYYNILIIKNGNSSMKFYL